MTDGDPRDIQISHSHAPKKRNPALDELQLFINGVYCPRPADTEWVFTQEWDLQEMLTTGMSYGLDRALEDSIMHGAPQKYKPLSMNDLMRMTGAKSQTLTLRRGDKTFTGVVTQYTEFLSPNGLRAINVEIDFNTTQPSERELLAIRAAQLALKDGS